MPALASSVLGANAAGSVVGTGSCPQPRAAGDSAIGSGCCRGGGEADGCGLAACANRSALVAARAVCHPFAARGAGEADGCGLADCANRSALVAARAVCHPFAVRGSLAGGSGSVRLCIYVYCWLSADAARAVPQCEWGLAACAGIPPVLVSIICAGQILNIAVAREFLYPL